MAELAQGLRLDLADALARDVELLADLLERAGAAVDDAEAQLEHLLLARGERVEHLHELLLEQREARCLARLGGVLIGDKVAEVGVLLLADRRLERDRLLRDLENVAHLVDRHVHLRRDLLGARVVAELLQELTGDADDLVDRLDHVHGDADGARLVGDGAGDGLPDPPRGVGGELVALRVVELFDGLDQAEIAFLDEVEKQHAAADIALGDRHDQTEVCLLHAVLGLRVALGHALGQLLLLLRGEQRHFADLLEVHAHRVVGRERVGHGLGLVHLFLGDFLDLLELLELGQRVLVHRGQRVVAEHVDVQALELVIELFRLLAREVHVLEHHEVLARELARLFALFHQIIEFFLRGLFRFRLFGYRLVLRGLVRGGSGFGFRLLGVVGCEQRVGHGVEFFSREVVKFFLFHLYHHTLYVL